MIFRIIRRGSINMLYIVGGFVRNFEKTTFLNVYTLDAIPLELPGGFRSFKRGLLMEMRLWEAF